VANYIDYIKEVKEIVCISAYLIILKQIIILIEKILEGKNYYHLWAIG
jgi:hypothetical protein